MYIDPKESQKMEHQDVNEATAALKGMLGIGGPFSAVPAAPAPPAAPDPPAAPSPTNSEGSFTAPKSTKKKKNNNSNKKKNKAKGALIEQDSKAKSGSNEEDQKAKQTGGKEGVTNQANQNSSKKNRKKKGKNENKPQENFAWSAFQSSPDASKLPIPAFSSPADVGRTVVRVGGDGPMPGILSQAPSGKIEGPADRLDGNIKTHAPVVAVEEPEPEDATPEAPVSKTGVNLAALSANPPPEAPLNSPSTPYMDRSMMPQNPPGAYNTPPMPPRYPHPGYSNPQQHHYPPPPPPGYVTVQVQVPPVLMPGRQMVVTSPAGYPVQVIVPDGIPPGFILPVHVPVGPPHMMPPPGQSPYGGRQFYSPNQAH
jgi:hypothetical protein